MQAAIGNGYFASDWSNAMRARRIERFALCLQAVGFPSDNDASSLYTMENPGSLVPAAIAAVLKGCLAPVPKAGP